jgi:hypothetical protein
MLKFGPTRCPPQVSARNLSHTNTREKWSFSPRSGEFAASWGRAKRAPKACLFLPLSTKSPLCLPFQRKGPHFVEGGFSRRGGHAWTFQSNFDRAIVSSPLSSNVGTIHLNHQGGNSEDYVVIMMSRPPHSRTMSTTLWPAHPAPPNSRRLFSNMLATFQCERHAIVARLTGDIRRSRRLSCFSVRMRPHMGRRIILWQVMIYNQDPDGFGTYWYQSIG